MMKRGSTYEKVKVTDEFSFCSESPPFMCKYAANGFFDRDDLSICK